MALLPDGALALINDDDFGITGARTQIVVVRGLTSTGDILRGGPQNLPSSPEAAVSGISTSWPIGVDTNSCGSSLCDAAAWA